MSNISSFFNKHQFLSGQIFGVAISLLLVLFGFCLGKSQPVVPVINESAQLRVTNPATNLRDSSKGSTADMSGANSEITKAESKMVLSLEEALPPDDGVDSSKNELIDGAVVSDSLFFTDYQIEPMFDGLIKPNDAKEAIYEFVKSRRSLMIGSGARHVYVLFSLGCDQCLKMYKEISEGSGSNLDITWHLIPVNLNTVSRDSAKLMLTLTEHLSEPAGADIVKAVSATSTTHVYNKIPPQQYSPQYALELDQNTAFLLQTTGQTPTSIFRDSYGNVTIFNERPRTSLEYNEFLR